MKAECEIAMKLMEKDVHEKQDTIISLRAQLEDIKSFNLEINTKVSTIDKIECKRQHLFKQIFQKARNLTFFLLLFWRKPLSGLNEITLSVYHYLYNNSD